LSGPKKRGSGERRRGNEGKERRKGDRSEEQKGRLGEKRNERKTKSTRFSPFFQRPRALC